MSYMKRAFEDWLSSEIDRISRKYDCPADELEALYISITSWEDPQDIIDELEYYASIPAVPPVGWE